MMQTMNSKKNDVSMKDFFSGDKLIGDDFDLAELAAWYEDEERAYQEMVAGRNKTFIYEYDALNKRTVFKDLGNDSNKVCLGYGAATGAELAPIFDSIGRLVIVDPGDFSNIDSGPTVPTEYVTPSISGTLALEDGTCDLITSFGALHHVANVSHVVSEFSRVLSSTGKVLIREPINSMGDWRLPRRGLTARERGIPKKIMDQAIAKAGLHIERSAYIDFPPFLKLMKKCGVSYPYNSAVYVTLDSLFSRLFAWNSTYHRTNIWSKFAPASHYWICSKG